MHSSLQISSELGGRALAMTSVPGLSNSHILYIHDPTNHLTFLIDTSTAINVLPPQLQIGISSTALPSHSYKWHTNPHIWQTLPHTQPGTETLTAMGILVAEVQKPIIGADFLHHFKFSVDLKKKALVNKTTDLSIWNCWHPLQRVHCSSS